jgi:hypothetical protein
VANLLINLKTLATKHIYDRKQEIFFIFFFLKQCYNCFNDIFENKLLCITNGYYSKNIVMQGWFQHMFVEQLIIFKYSFFLII